MEDRLKKLNFAVTILRPGSLTLTAMNRRAATVLWKALDTATVWCLSCAVSIAARLLLTTYRRLHDSCCSNFDCWVADWSAGQRSILLLAVLAILSFPSWLQMSFLVSQIPRGLRSSYSSSFYVSGFLVGLSVLRMTNPQQSRLASTVANWNMHMHIPDARLAMQELASLSMLWLNLFDARMELGHDDFQWFVFFWRLVVAGFGAVLGFCLVEPLQELQCRISYRWHVGDLYSGGQVTPNNPSSFSVQKICQGIGMVGVACLPILILLYYSHSDHAMANLRALAAWLFLLLLCLLTKTLLQDYLQEALLHVVSTPARPLGSNPGEHANDDSTAITNTFTSRYGWGANSCHFLYLANVEKTQTWEQQQVQAMAQSVLNNDVNSTRRPRDGNAESCQVITALSAASSTKKIEEVAITNPVDLHKNFVFPEEVLPRGNAL